MQCDLQTKTLSVQVSTLHDGFKQEIDQQNF